MPRRLFLAAGSAAAVFTALQGATAMTAAPTSADADLFALVDQCKHWWGEMSKYSLLCDEVVAEEQSREVQPEHETLLEEAQAEYQAAFDEALGKSPQTTAGARALLEWIQTDSRGIGIQSEHADALLANMLASPILALEA
jgi:hypothetical protein